jgi:hypothetical protein
MAAGHGADQPAVLLDLWTNVSDRTESADALALVTDAYGQANWRTAGRDGHRLTPSTRVRGTLSNDSHYGDLNQGPHVTQHYGMISNSRALLLLST